MGEASELTRRQEFLAGMKDTIPMIIGAIPFGIIFGALAVTGDKPLTPAATLGHVFICVCRISTIHWHRVIFAGHRTASDCRHHLYCQSASCLICCLTRTLYQACGSSLDVTAWLLAHRRNLCGRHQPLSTIPEQPAIDTGIILGLPSLCTSIGSCAPWSASSPDNNSVIKPRRSVWTLP